MPRERPLLPQRAQSQVRGIMHFIQLEEQERGASGVQRLPQIREPRD